MIFLFTHASTACSALHIKQAATSVLVQTIELTNKIPEQVSGPYDANDEHTKKLIDTLELCSERDIVKFRPKYKITVYHVDNSIKTFLIFNSYMKIDGLTYKCSENLESLIDAIRTPE